MKVRALPSREKPPRQCWHQAPTKATQSKPRPPRRTQKGRKGRSGIFATGWWHLGRNKMHSEAPTGLLLCADTPGEEPD